MNKHGYMGVRKKIGPQWAKKPYYFKMHIGLGRYFYSKQFATAEEASIGYQEMKTRGKMSAVPDKCLYCGAMPGQSCAYKS